MDTRGKKIKELAAEGFFGKKLGDIPAPGERGRDEFEEKVRSVDAYSKFFNRYTEIELAGSVQQVDLAQKIRAKIVDKEVFTFIVDSIFVAFGIDTDDYLNKKWKTRFAMLNNNSAYWWINKAKHYFNN